MSNAAIFIGWNEARVGRERQSLKVFAETIEYFAGLQGRGEIDGFEPFLLNPHGGDLGGFILVRGDRDKLDRVRVDPAFEKILARAQTVVTRVGVVDATTGEELQRRFGGWLDNVSDLL